MIIPDKVKVAGYTYNIERPAEAFPDGTVVCDGIHWFNEQIIRVARTGNEQYQSTIFIHELVHAIIASYCGVDNQDEQFVEQLAKGLYQVITDNPEIFK